MMKHYYSVQFAASSVDKACHVKCKVEWVNQTTKEDYLTRGETRIRKVNIGATFPRWRVLRGARTTNYY